MMRRLEYLQLVILAIALFAFPQLVSATACTNNWQGGECTGNIIYTTGTTLTNNVNATGNIQINLGVKIDTEGYNFWIGGTWNALGGIIQTDNTIGTGGASLGLNGGGGNNGNSILTSYGGSGAGGQACGLLSGCSGGNGGSTIASGGSGGTGSGGAGTNGIAPSTPFISNAIIQQWYNAGFQMNLSGAGGGSGGAGPTNGGDKGGNGADGVYIQANMVTALGTIFAYGSNQVGSANCGGGGGGGAVILATTSGPTEPGDSVVDNYGGNTNGCGTQGTGGSGVYNVFIYSIPPIPTTPPVFAFSSVYASNALAMQGQAELITTNVMNGAAPYSYNIVIYNSISSNVVFKSIISNSLTTNSVSFTLPVEANDVGTLQISANIVSGSANVLGFNTIIISPTTPQISCMVGATPVTGNGIYNTLLVATPITCSIVSLNNVVTTGNMFVSSSSGQQQASGNYLTINQVWNGGNYIVIANTLAQAGYAANSVTFAVNDLPYELISSSIPSNIGYETQSQTFSYTLNISKIAVNTTIYLQLNGNIVQTILANVINAAQIFNFNYNLPLTATNNIQNNFIVTGKMQYGNGPFYTYLFGTVNALTQNELWDYVPSTTSQNSNMLLGGSDKIFMNIVQPVSLSLAVVNVSNFEVGNSVPSGYSSVIPYDYYTQLSNFNPKLYGYPNPTSNVPVAIAVNSFLQLYYNGQNVWRNTTANPAFNVYNANLTTCTTLNPTQAFTFTFYNASTGLQFTQNVQLNANFRVNNGNVIPGNSAGIPLTTNGFEYWTCESPSWATFGTNSSFLNYSTSAAITKNVNTITSAPASFYLLNYPTSNVVTNFKLYLSYITNPSSYSLQIENASFGTFPAGIVYVQQFNVNGGNTVIVNEVNISANQGTVVTLQYGTKYIFSAYSLQGIFLGNATLQSASCASGSTCQFTIPFGSGAISDLQTPLSNIFYGCTQTALSGNVEKVQCNLNAKNSQNIYGELQIWAGGLIFNTITCTSTDTAPTMTLICTAPNTQSTSYHYALSAAISGFGLQQLQTGDFGYIGGQQYGSVDWLILIMLIAVSSLAFVKVPAIGMTTAFISILVAYFLGGIILTAGTIGALFTFFALSVWVLGRGGLS